MSSILKSYKEERKEEGGVMQVEAMGRRFSTSDWSFRIWTGR
jgi:hypothetical protein